MVKGVLCLAGLSPRRTHSIEELLTQYIRKLGEKGAHLPYFLVLKSSSDNHYGIELIGDKASLYKSVGGSWTYLSSMDISSISVDGLVTLKLSYKNNVLIPYHKDEVLTSHTDSSLGNGEMVFQRSPDNERIEKIVYIGKLLRKNRELAFYSEKNLMKKKRTLPL